MGERGTRAHMMCSKMSGQPICLSVHFHLALRRLHFHCLRLTRLKDATSNVKSLWTRSAKSWIIVKHLV